MATSHIDDHLEREWEQAWTHYRHLESSRMQYLGFFLTVLIGAVPVAAALASYLPLATAMLAIMALAFVVFLLAVSLYLSIRKTGFVLWRYSRILQTIRQRSGHRSSAALPFDLADLEECPRYISDPNGAFSAQRSTERLLAVMIAVLVVVLGGIAIYSWTLASGIGMWQAVVTSLAAVVALARALSITPQVAAYLYERRKGRGEGGDAPHPRAIDS